MKKFLIPVLGLISLFFGSCSTEEIADNKSSETVLSADPYLVTPEQAKTNVLECYENLVANGSKTRAASEVEIKDIKLLTPPTSATTRSADGFNKPLFYIMNLSSGGFAVASADNRTSPVFAITDGQPYDETGAHPEFNELLEEMYFALAPRDTAVSKEQMQQDAEDRFNNYTKRNLKLKFGPHLPTKWGQSYKMFANYLPTNHAGCAVIAAGQICAYYNYPSVSSWTYGTQSVRKTMHWPAILEYSNTYRYGNNNGLFGDTFCVRYGSYTDIYDKELEVASLLRQIGLEMNASYRADGTGVTESNMRKWFTTNGFTITSTADFKTTTAKSHIANKRNLMILATGHVWVIDGYALYNSYKWGDEDMFHCNYGWGDYADGWYLSGCFSLDQKLFEDNGGAAQIQGDRKFQYPRFFAVSR